jgi:hypothetical protein
MIYSNNWNITLPINQNFDLPIKDVEDQNSAQKSLDILTAKNFNQMLEELTLHINSIDESKLSDVAFLNLQIKKAFNKLIQNSIKSYDIDDFYSPNGKIPFPKEKNPYIQFQDDIF